MSRTYHSPSSPSRTSVLEPHNCLNKKKTPGPGEPQAQAEVALNGRGQERQQAGGTWPYLTSGSGQPLEPLPTPSKEGGEAQQAPQPGPVPRHLLLGESHWLFWPTQMETEGVQGWALPAPPPHPLGPSRADTLVAELREQRVGRWKHMR